MNATFVTMVRPPKAEKGSCLWKEKKGMCAREDFCLACEERADYSRKYVRDHNIPMTGVCLMLIGSKDDNERKQQQALQESEESKRTRSTRASENRKENAFEAAPANGAKMLIQKNDGSKPYHQRRKEDALRMISGSRDPFIKRAI